MPGYSITDEEIDRIVSDISNEPLVTPEGRLRTRDQLAEQFPNQSRNLPCPRCKRALTLRDGKFGVFYGCPDYPRCRGTIDANQATGEPVKSAAGSMRVKELCAELKALAEHRELPAPDLRRARKEAEDTLEQVWKTGRMKKKAAEKMVAEKLGRPLCFTDLDVAQCQIVINFARDRLRPRTRFDVIDEFDESSV